MGSRGPGEESHCVAPYLISHLEDFAVPFLKCFLSLRSRVLGSGFFQ